MLYYIVLYYYTILLYYIDILYGYTILYYFIILLLVPDMPNLTASPHTQHRLPEIIVI